MATSITFNPDDAGVLTDQLAILGAFTDQDDAADIVAAIASAIASLEAEAAAGSVVAPEGDRADGVYAFAAAVAAWTDDEVALFERLWNQAAPSSPVTCAIHDAVTRALGTGV